VNTELCQFLSYWHSLGGGRIVPERKRLELRQLTAILRWMFILELSDEGTLKFRLAGSAIEDALGCGITDRDYSDVFSQSGQHDIMEELYALSVVQGCGVLRRGTFTLDGIQHHSMEVLSLPFTDPRVLGGTVMVGVVRPFNHHNNGFKDRREGFNQNIESLFLVPSPHLVTCDQLPQRLQAKITEKQLELRALDTERLLELSASGEFMPYSEFPSHQLDTFVNDMKQALN
jgi:hypothetical protein